MTSPVYITTIAFLLLLIIFLIVVIFLLRRRTKRTDEAVTVTMSMKDIEAKEEEPYGNEDYIYYDSIQPASSTV